MRKTALRSHRIGSRDSDLDCLPKEKPIKVTELSDQITGWLLDDEIRQLSPATISLRRTITDNLLWFLEKRAYRQCGAKELRAFLAYVSHGDPDEAGRWGHAHLRKEATPRTVQLYHQNLSILFSWLVEEGAIKQSPMDDIRKPIDRPDQVQPFTPDQVKAILDAARKSRFPVRDEAIVLLLLDTGCRASELCGLTVADVDIQGRRAVVQGKGGKSRELVFSATTGRALWRFLREHPRDKGEPLFCARRGPGASGPMTRNGLKQLIGRLGKYAGITAVRCSPHTFRHTFAIEFLRAGGQPFALKLMLGHTTLAMTNKYVALAQADLRTQHQQFSPVERLKTRKKDKR